MFSTYSSAPYAKYGRRKETISPGPELFYNKQVCIDGVIEMYKGRPQIVIKSEYQILRAVAVDIH